MAQKKGLGRGYASLLGLNEFDGEEVPVEGAEGGLLSDAAARAANARPELALEMRAGESATEIQLSDIDPNYEQPRKNFNPESLSELADSIRLHGVIQPVIVTPAGKRFMLIAGERRFRASKLANKTSIPAIIRNYTTQQIREIALVENLQRDDLNAIEAARAIKTLMEEHNMTQEAAADRLGKSRSAIANTLRLLTLDANVVSLIEGGSLSAGHGRALVVVPDSAEQYKLALKAVDQKLSVRDLEKLVRAQLNPKKEDAAPKPEPTLELKNLIDNMQRAFATRVWANGNENKGRIYIDYFTKDDLDRISTLVENWMESDF